MINGNDPEAQETPFTENELEEILGQLPTLVRLRQFAARLSAINWFHRVGEPFDPALKETAQTYLDLLGFPQASILPVRDWQEAADLAESPDFDTPSWQAEELIRVNLEARALDSLDPEAIAVALAHVNSILSKSIRMATLDIAALWDIQDTELLTAAAGSVHQTCQLCALAILCELDEDTPLTVKFELYRMGRWPISITGASFNLF